LSEANVIVATVFFKGAKRDDSMNDALLLGQVAVKEVSTLQPATAMEAGLLA
jgi:hypothetical protein